MALTSDPNSAYAFAYNGDAEVTSVDNNGTPNVPDVVLASSYDAAGDRTGLSATIAGTADSANTYVFNDDQELTTVQQQGVNGGNIVSPKEIDYVYNALGQFSSVVDFNFIGDGPREDILTGAYSYDNGSRLTGIAYTSNGGTDTIDTLGWGYDAANNVTSFSSIDGTAAYGYDPTNQLTSATYTTASGGHQPANESFSFDLNGNRNSTGDTTGSDNLMSSDGTFNYQHDADGNIIVRTTISNSYASDYETTYTWDYRNRLTDVEYYDNNQVLTKHVHFVYDVFDHLLATEVDPTGGGTYTEIQHYVLDVSPEIPQAGVPGTALAQPDLIFDGNQNLIQRNLVALSPAGVAAVLVQGTVVSTSQGDNDIFVAYDNLGTPRDDVDGTGTLVNHKVFSVFGQDVYDSNSSIVNWAGFAGGHADPNTGLVDDYHRWLNTADGKWLTDDPTGFGAGDADLSRYAFNSPTNGTDNTGLGFWSNYGYYGQNIWSGMAAGAANGALNGAAYGGVIGGISTGGPGMGPGMAVGALLGGLFGAVTGGVGAMDANSPGQAAQIGYYYGGTYGPLGGLAGGLAGPAMAAEAYASYLAGLRASQAAALNNEIAGYIASRTWWQQQMAGVDQMEAKGIALTGFHEAALRRIAAINAAIAAAEKKLSNL